MNKTSLIIAVSLALHAADGMAYDYQANTGALSYMFFNLSPNQWTLTPYGGGKNPQAPVGSNAYNSGWGNQSGSMGFFNPVGISGGSCAHPSQQVIQNTIFYNQNADPINPPSGEPFGTSKSQINLPAGSYNNSYVETSQAVSTPENAPAMGDSWALSLTLPGELSNATPYSMVMANMASAPNMFITGSGSDYPYCASLVR